MQGMVFSRARIHIDGERDQFEAGLPPSEKLQLVGRTEGTAVEASSGDEKVELALPVVITAEERFGSGLGGLPDLLRSVRSLVRRAIGSPRERFVLGAYVADVGFVHA